MNVAAIQALMARRFGNRTDLDATVLLELQIAQEYHETGLIHTRPWFLLEEMSELNTVAGEERLIVPSNFESEYENGTLWIFDSSASDPWIELQKGVYDQLKAEYIGTGQPQKYSLVNKYFRLHPAPDVVYTMKMLYYRHDSAIVDSTTENLWLSHVPRLLTSYAGISIALNLRDPQREARFQADYDNAMKHFITENINRRMVNFTPDDEDQ